VVGFEVTVTNSLPSKNPKPQFLERMGLDNACSPQEVAAAYRRLAKVTHPDQGGTKQAFQQLHRDYEEAKRYVERAHDIRPPTGWQPAQGSETLRPPQNTVAKAPPHTFGSLLILVVTVASGLMALVGFQSHRLSMTSASSLIAIVGCMYCVVIWLPKLQRGTAVVCTVFVWFLATCVMIFIRDEIAMAFFEPHLLEEEWVVFYGFAPVGYFTLTIFGLLGISVTLVRD
jgi:hypothetical protein